MTEHAYEYIQARRTLLDALDALGSHRDSLVLIGAQPCTCTPDPPV